MIDFTTAKIVQVSLLTIVLFSLFLAGLWDVYCYWVSRPDCTVTAALQSLGGRIPVLILACGILIGHLWFPGSTGESPGK